MIDLKKGDCLKLMNSIPDKSIDLVLCDLPYGTTNNKWDTVIPFNELWEQYNRIIKDHGAIVLFGAEPFSSKLRLSNLRMYRYDWIWCKSRVTLFQHAHHRPMNKNELISVFYKHLPTYNPQMSEGKPYKDSAGQDSKTISKGFIHNEMKKLEHTNSGTRFPTTLLKYANSNRHKYHPTEKPVGLLEYLIKTYTNKGDLVLDNCMGSGSTGVAAKRLKRDFIGYELNGHYFDVAKKRLRHSTECLF